jgi:hypothetical protein
MLTCNLRLSFSDPVVDAVDPRLVVVIDPRWVVVIFEGAIGLAKFGDNAVDLN